jgi:RNA polymerase-interacting CarD/CdnL/TRCF family regulator
MPAAATKNGLRKGELLFHPTHGLCELTGVVKSSGSKEDSYLVQPVQRNHDRIRFIIPQEALVESGFDRLITADDARAILKYLETGEKKKSRSCQAWDLATTVFDEASTKEFIKDARRRHALERAVKGLAGQLSCVLRCTIRQTADTIQKKLKAVSAVNPLVAAMLQKVEQD